MNSICFDFVVFIILFHRLSVAAVLARQATGKFTKRFVGNKMLRMGFVNGVTFDFHLSLVLLLLDMYITAEVGRCQEDRRFGVVPTYYRIYDKETKINLGLYSYCLSFEGKKLVYSFKTMKINCVMQSALVNFETRIFLFEIEMRTLIFLIHFELRRILGSLSTNLSVQRTKCNLIHQSPMTSTQTFSQQGVAFSFVIK